MMKRIALSLGLALLATAGCEGRTTTSEPPPPSGDAQLRQDIARWGVVPIGAMPAQNPALVALGRALFFDPILSGNRDIACATCHDPATALADGRSLPIGTGGSGAGPARTLDAARGFVPRHAPSLLNSGIGSFYMMWDGRLSSFGPGNIGNQTGIALPAGLTTTLIAQAMLPVLDRREMRGEPGDRDIEGNINELAKIADNDPSAVWNAIMRRLAAIPGYLELFAGAFPNRAPDLLRFEDAARALAAFQMQAFTKTNSPFDRFLDRDDAALTAEQKRGAVLFFGEVGCAGCHSGPFLGGQGFANVGIPQIGPGTTALPPLDLGRGAIENNDFYRFAFRVASLRNVELTAPYMHDGAYPTLEAVLRHYDNVLMAARSYDATQLEPSLRGLVHTDATTVNTVLGTLDGRLQVPLDLTDAEQHALIAFLKSLTDPSARDLRALIPASVPSGLAVK